MTLSKKAGRRIIDIENLCAYNNSDVLWHCGLFGFVAAKNQQAGSGRKFSPTGFKTTNKKTHTVIMNKNIL